MLLLDEELRRRSWSQCGVVYWMLHLDEELRCQPWSQCNVDWVRGSFDEVVLVDSHFKDTNKVESQVKILQLGRDYECLALLVLCSVSVQGKSRTHSPLSGKFDFWEAFLTISIFLFVDCDVFSAARTADTVLLVNLDFFLVASTFLAVGKRGGEGRISRFVIFPSDARSS